MLEKSSTVKCSREKLELFNLTGVEQAKQIQRWTEWMKKKTLRAIGMNQKKMTLYDLFVPFSDYLYAKPREIQDGIK